jgi:hypothetical protein
MAASSSGWGVSLAYAFGLAVGLGRGLGLKGCSHDDIAHPLGDDIIGIDCSSPPPQSNQSIYLLFNRNYGHCC